MVEINSVIFSPCDEFTFQIQIWAWWVIKKRHVWPNPTYQCHSNHSSSELMILNLCWWKWTAFKGGVFVWSTEVCDTHGFSKHSHELWELMREERQHSCEGAETRREEDEERQLLLRIHWHLVEHCLQTDTHTHTRAHTHTRTQRDKDTHTHRQTHTRTQRESQC